MVSLWSLNDCKSPQVSRTLLSIPADSYAVVWMVSTCRLISKSSSPFYQSFEECPICTNHSWYHHHLHVPEFFLVLLLGLGTYPSSSLSLIFTLSSAGKAKSTIRQVFFLSFFSFFILLTITKSGRLAKIPENFVHFILQDWFWVVHIPLVRMVKLNIFARLPIVYLSYPVVCQVLYSLCANLLHSLIIWLIVSSLSPNNLHLLFCWVLSIFALI